MNKLLLFLFIISSSIVNNYEATLNDVVIVGRSNLVGKPLMNLFINANATVTLCHSKTKNLDKITKKADILVAAVGKKHFITQDMVKRNSVIRHRLYNRF